MTPVPLRIIKLGGSLLEWEGLPAALTVWLAKNQDAENWMIVGGGQRADAVRKRAARESLSDEAAHWLAIQAMQENAADVSRRLNWPMMQTSEGNAVKHFLSGSALAAGDACQIVKPAASAEPLICPPCGDENASQRFRKERHDCRLIDVARFLRDDEPHRPGTVLAHNWDVTSDSIAARLAITSRAIELVLLKSTLPPDHTSLEALAETGYIDRFLPRLERELPPMRFVDLRNSF